MVKVYSGNLAVEVFHSFHIKGYVIDVSLADSVKRNGDICNNGAVTDGRCCHLFCGISDTFHGKSFAGISVWIVSIIAQNVQRLAGCSGNHLVGQPHFSGIIYTKICAGFFALAYQTVVYHISTVFHLNVIKSCSRFLRRSIRNYFLLDLYTKCIHGCVFDCVGRIGSSGNGIQIIEFLGIVHVKAGKLLFHSLCASKAVDCLVQVHLVIICMGSLEIISCKSHIGNSSVFYCYLGSYVVVTKLLHLCSADLGCKVQGRIAGFFFFCIINLKESVRRITHGIYIHA